MQEPRRAWRVALRRGAGHGRAQGGPLPRPRGGAAPPPRAAPSSSSCAPCARRGHLARGVLAQGTPFAIFSWFVLVQRAQLDAPTAFVALAWIQQLQWSTRRPASYAWPPPSLRRLCAVIDSDGDADAPPPAAPPCSTDDRGSRGSRGGGSSRGCRGRRPHRRLSTLPPCPRGRGRAAARTAAGAPPASRRGGGAAGGASCPPSAAAPPTTAAAAAATATATRRLRRPRATARRDTARSSRDIARSSCRSRRRSCSSCAAPWAAVSRRCSPRCGARPLAAGTRATPRRAYVAQHPFLMRESGGTCSSAALEGARYERALTMAARAGPACDAARRRDGRGRGRPRPVGGQRARVASCVLYAEAERSSSTTSSPVCAGGRRRRA